MVRSTFPSPLPPEVARALRMSREEQMELVLRSSASGGGAGAGGANQGQFAVGFKEARRFLKERLGITVRADREAAMLAAQLDSSAAGPSLGLNPLLGTGGEAGAGKVEEGHHALQRFADIVEDELEEWLGTEVYLNPDLEPSSTRVVVDSNFMRPLHDEIYDYDDDGGDEREARYGDGPAVSSTTGPAQQEEEDDDEPCIVELASAPHSLRWSVPSPLLRYAVHCLARIHGCPSFSKDATTTTAATGASSSKSRVPPRRETWILNPNPAARGTRRSGMGGASGQAAAGSRRSGGGGASALTDQGQRRGAGLETPPTTDIGTDIGTDSELGFSTEHELEHEHDGAGSSSEAELGGGLSHHGRRELNGHARDGGGAGGALADSVIWSEDDEGGSEAGEVAGPAARFHPRFSQSRPSRTRAEEGAGDETLMRDFARARIKTDDDDDDGVVIPERRTRPATSTTTTAAREREREREQQRDRNQDSRAQDLPESTISALSLGGYEREDEEEDEDDELDTDSLSGSGVLPTKR
ncbi:hypothetical protein V8E36_006325 [Tilletia maclaganii]